MVTSACRACGALCTERGHDLVEGHGLTGIGLCERTVDRCVQLLAIGVGHPIVIVIAFDAGQQRMSDLQPHGLIEREELLEELLRDGHVPSLPERTAEVDVGFPSWSRDTGVRLLLDDPQLRQRYASA
ncbi:MAG: hypothetical protein ABI467_32315 [Kofleriaceae bacterium]